jgi:lipoprotein-anchoring transpeptidase ErfK/SrfK
MADGTVQNFGTTPGLHRILLKRPSQHMVGGAAGDNDYYDLPGVSWISYFTASGISFHGTYWHNDYGRPRSHGCVNMLPEDAKWVFRWTLPTAAYDLRFTRPAKRADGTLVKVF